MSSRPVAVCKPSRAYPPIALLTAMSKPDPETQGANAGAALTLRKPFSIDQVVHTVMRDALK